MKKVRLFLVVFVIFSGLLLSVEAGNIPAYKSSNVSVADPFFRAPSTGFTSFSGFNLTLPNLSSLPPPPIPDSFELRCKKYGHLSICDGISVFTFSHVGTFSQKPVGISGEVATGRWSLDQNQRFVIIGTWGWMNGASESFPNSRRMIISIEPNGKVATWNIRDTPVLVYEGDFKILETVKLPVPVPMIKLPK